MRATKLPWQSELIDVLTEPKVLFEYLELDMEYLTEAEEAAKLFPLKVTRSYLERIEKGNLNDPLLLQILPLGIEKEAVHGFNKDILQEKKVNPLPGLLHKYHGRVLLIATGACGIHCRYCFRRDFAYGENNPGLLGWQPV